MNKYLKLFKKGRWVKGAFVEKELRKQGGWNLQRNVSPQEISKDQKVNGSCHHLKWFLHNLMKLWSMLCRATQDRQVKVKSSEKTRSTGGGNGKSLQYSCQENPINYIKRQKDMTLEDEPQVRRCPVCYRKEHRAITNGSRMKEAAGPKLKWCSAVGVPGGESKVQCCKEQYCIWT